MTFLRLKKVKNIYLQNLLLEILTSGVFLWSVSYIGYMSITIILLFLESWSNPPYTAESR